MDAGIHRAHFPSGPDRGYTCKCPLAGRCTARAAFTLIELLVVIAIIAILASMLFPVLGQAKEKVRVINCLHNQKQMGLALVTYASDFTEYPTNWSNGTNDRTFNSNDECAGKWYEGSDTGAYEGYIPNKSEALNLGTPWGTKGAWARLAVTGYVPYKNTEYPGYPVGSGLYMTPTGINLCSANRLSDGYYFLGGGQAYQIVASSLYSYNGPHAEAGCIANNGSLSGLYRLGRHHEGVNWGVRYNGNPPAGFSLAQIAFLGCPSLYLLSGGAWAASMEPHGSQTATAGCTQGDNDSYYGNFGFDRNFLYADLHAEYLHAASRAGIP